MAIETVYNGKGERVSELAHADPLTGSEYVIVVQGGRTRVISADDIVDMINKTLDGSLNTSYLVVAKGGTGYSEDLSGRVVFQNDILKGKSGYLVESKQLGIKFSPVQGVDISYNAVAGSFTVIVPGFVLLDSSQLFVWVNLLKTTGGGDVGGANSIDYRAVGTYLEMYTNETPVRLTIYKVLDDEITGQKKAIYQWWPDGDLVLITGSVDSTDPGDGDTVTYMLPGYVQANYAI
jgi:hypothetical protein